MSSCTVAFPIGLIVILAIMLLPIGAKAFGQIGGRKQPAPAAAQPKADQRVVRALNEAKLKYSVNEFNDCELIFELDGDRTHLVHVDSQTEKWGEMEIRSVWAFGYISKARLSQSKLEKLLKANGQLKSGAWHLLDGEKVAAVFSVKVAADCDGESLRTVVTGVAKQADKMETLLMSGQDDF
jgi:hypothetical protein